jgi:hypothetical protein
MEVDLELAAERENLRSRVGAWTGEAREKSEPREAHHRM